MTKHKRIAVKLYLLNLAILATHEIDSAFWHEWNLFKLPGGIDLFLGLNLALLLLFMFGLEKVVVWKNGAAVFSYLLAFSGIFAFVIHSYFILSGNPEFTSVISFGILLLTFVTSIAQIVFLILIKRKKVL
jgi:ABC-type transport system involved in cytochrome c biogenesis permease subunit